jgi:hypothetical protein
VEAAKRVSHRSLSVTHGPLMRGIMWSYGITLFERNSMPWIYLDNNIINRISDELQSEEMIRKMQELFLTRISLLLLVEIGSTENAERRIRLLDIAKQLSRDVKAPPLEEPRIIWQRQAEAFTQNGTNFNPCIESLDYEKAKIWSFLQNPESLNNHFSLSLLGFKRNLDTWYDQMLSGLRPDAQVLMDYRGRNRGKSSTLASFLKFVRKHEEFVSNQVLKLISDPTLRAKISGRELALIRSNNLWPYFLVGIGIGIYSRAIQINNFSPKRNASGTDIMQVVYLAFTDIFVTEDISLRKLLQTVTKYGFKQHRPIIWSYNDLKRAVLHNIAG